MPDINDLLRGAAPDPGTYDEDGIRRRVERRRRTRRVVAGLGALLVVIIGAVAVLSATGDDEQPVVADRPTTTGGSWAAYPDAPTSVAIVGDEVWIGGDHYVSLGDGSSRIDLPAKVTRLGAEDGVLWASGTDWVTAVDVATQEVVGLWSGDALGDVEPLPNGEALLTLTLADEVAVVRTAAEGLEEIERFAVGDAPTDIVETTSGDVWIREGSDGKARATIALVDWGAGGVTERCDWGYPLYAPALDGTIWTTDGDRVVSLDTAILRTGALSAAIGERYDVDATMAVETSFGLFTGGPGGVVRFSPQTPDGEVITTDVPDALDASGGQVAYIAGGEVHTASAKGDQTVDPQAWQKQPRQVAARYLSDELHWPDVIIDRDEDAPGTADDPYKSVYATSATLGRDARVQVHLFEGVWSVNGLWTFGADDHPASVSLGHGSDHVGFDFRDPVLAPVLTVRYGSSHTTFEHDAGADAVWDGDLGFVADTQGFVQVLFLNADGVALEGWATSLPPGPFAAG
jgi:hypothetical protein